MPCNAAYAFCACLLLNIFFLYGCSGDGTSNPQANGTAGTGSFACTLNWPHDDPADKNASYTARAVYCDAAGIDVVCFTFYRSADLMDRFYFECDLHFGRVEDLPVGSDYRVEITAEDADGVVLYQGEYGPFEITEGETTPGGIIPMELAGPLAAIVGSWEVDFDWFCDGYDGTMTLILNDDFSFTAHQEGFADSSGYWSLWGDGITWTYANGTEYDGTFDENFTFMEGLMNDLQGGWGCWEGY